MTDYQVPPLSPMPLAMNDVPVTGVHEHISDLDPLADNVARAGLAAVGLRAYAVRKGLLEESPQLVVTDFLNDLRHLCDSLALDFDALALEDLHYAAELTGTL